MNYRDELYKQIIGNIRRVRIERGMTQAVLAEKMDVSHEFIRRIESAKGKKSLSIKTVYKASLALEVSLASLFDIDLDKLKDEN